MTSLFINRNLSYIKQQGGEVLFGQQVQRISRGKAGYIFSTQRGVFTSRFVISGIPLNNTLAIYQGKEVKLKLQKYLMPSEMLNGAFTMGLVLQGQAHAEVLHHQVHVPEGLPFIGSKSIFISFSHSKDGLRAPAGEIVASISTHVSHPDQHIIQNKAAIEAAIVEVLMQRGLIRREAIKYIQSATPGAWIFWT
jgi:phytoene dehydrogenase-like protein